MTKRKDQLRSLFGILEPVVETQAEARPEPQLETKSAAPVAAQPAEPVKRSASGAVKAMGLSLGTLGREIEEARRLRDSLSAGDHVIELDPGLIEASPFADRISQAQVRDESFETLKQSIADSGQQVPVLVRPHQGLRGQREGLYQAAYGHRRIEVARQLGVMVRAVVKPLSDIELVTAQGNENAERRDLSYIERALFADVLLKGGFERAVIMSALSVDKTELSRLLQTAGAVPRDFIDAVGAAPKAGRPRWLAMGEMLADQAQQHAAWDEIGSERFKNVANSDERFQLLFDRLSAKTLQIGAGQAAPAEIQAMAGGKIAEVQHKAGRAVFTIPVKAGAGFADYLAAELPRLHAEFQRAQDAEK